MNRTTRRILISVAGAALAVGAAPAADATLCNGLCAATTGRVHNTGIHPVDRLVDQVGSDLEAIDVGVPGVRVPVLEVDGPVRVPGSDAPAPIAPTVPVAKAAAAAVSTLPGG